MKTRTKRFSPNSPLIDVMKRFFLPIFLTLALARMAPGQASSTYINNGTVTVPPVIDATNFINNGSFNLAFNTFTNSSAGFNVIFINNVSPPFDFSDVLNYTNRNFMASDTGFIFDWAPSGNGPPRHPSANFVNSNPGSISAGSFSNSFTSSFLIFETFSGLGEGSGPGLPLLKVSATNVVNTGLLDVGLDGLLSVGGDNVNLARGALHIEGFDDFAGSGAFSGGILSGASLAIGVFDNLAAVGVGTNLDENFTLPFPNSPLYTVTNGFGTNQLILQLPNSEAFVYTNQISISNNVTQVVFINTNAGMSTDVRFEPAGDFPIPVVQWLAIITNNPTVPAVTNTLYLADSFGARTNLQLVTNFFSLSGQPSSAPINYGIAHSFFGYDLLPPGNSQFDPSLLATSDGATNAFSAWDVTVSPVTFQPDPTSLGSTITNVPGRIEITANKFLDLTRARITGANYVRLTSTNHYAGSSNAQIVFPTGDINIGTTNGMLS